MSYNKKTNLYEGYIYCITNTVNNKKYIGQTYRTIEERWKEHCKYTTSKSKHEPKSIISKAIKKYGKENFTVCEIEKIAESSTTALKDSLNQLEVYYVKSNDSMIINGHGYNVTEGGDSSGIIYTKPIIQYDIDGNCIREFQSSMEASRFTGIAFSDINHCCNKDRWNTAGGYRWSFVGDSCIVDDNYKNKEVYKYDMFGNLVEKYKNVNSITGDKSTRNKIRNCCSGYTQNVNGYVYRYKNDAFDKFKVKRDQNIKGIPVKQYSLDGNLLNTFISAETAALSIKDRKANRSCITAVCRGKKKRAYGFIWKYANDNYI